MSCTLGVPGMSEEQLFLVILENADCKQLIGNLLQKKKTFQRGKKLMINLAQGTRVNKKITQKITQTAQNNPRKEWRLRVQTQRVNGAPAHKHAGGEGRAPLDPTSPALARTGGVPGEASRRQAEAWGRGCGGGRQRRHTPPHTAVLPPPPQPPTTPPPGRSSARAARRGT